MLAKYFNPQEWMKCNVIGTEKCFNWSFTNHFNALFVYYTFKHG